MRGPIDMGGMDGGGGVTSVGVSIVTRGGVVGNGWSAVAGGVPAGRGVAQPAEKHRSRSAAALRMNGLLRRISPLWEAAEQVR